MGIASQTMGEGLVVVIDALGAKGSICRRICKVLGKISDGVRRTVETSGSSNADYAIRVIDLT